MRPTDKPRLLVFGATGMAGQALLKEAKLRSWPVYGAARQGTDISCDITNPKNVGTAIDHVKPDIIINAAAMIGHAQCTQEPGMAYLVNANAVALIAGECREKGIHLTQISTDHYFSGDGAAPHTEDAPVRLVNTYARTKFAGEGFAMTHPDALVVRTNITGFRGWPDRPTFAEWCCKVFEDNLPATLFTDYYTSTLDTENFARALLELSERRVTGLLNLASREVFSKAHFITVLAARFERSLTNVAYSSVHECLGDRAESLGLDVSRAEALLGYRLPTLADVAAALKAQYGER